MSQVKTTANSRVLGYVDEGETRSEKLLYQSQKSVARVV